jgi:hypothetical protein
MSSGLPRRVERRRAWVAGIWLLALVAGAAASGCATSGAIHAGQQAEKLQDYDRAVVEYTKALRADPTNIEARRSLDRANSGLLGTICAVGAWPRHWVRGSARR